MAVGLYRDCEGHDHRFVRGVDYRILEPGPITLYAHRERVWHARNSIWDLTYWFSADPSSPLLELTKKNLKAAYPDNVRFHGSLDSRLGFRGVTRYDKARQRFAVNVLYLESLTKGKP